MSVGAASVFALARAAGGYGVGAWAPAGAACLLGTAILVVAGLVPSRPVLVASGLLVGLGGWSVLSTAWGGIPFQAWRFLDQALIAASALVIGSLLAATGRRLHVVAAVLTGLVLESGETLLRALFGTVPSSWFYERRFQGPIGYHSAQASACAVGAAIAVAFLDSRRTPGRAICGAAAVLLLSVLLLTQSRAGALAAVVAMVVSVASRRDTRSLIRAVPVGVAGGLLILPLRSVDRALVDGTGVESALRAYAGWTCVALAVVGVLCAIPLGSRRVRLAIASVITLAAVVGGATLAVVEARPGSAAHRLVTSLHQLESNPSTTAAAGQTRLLSLSLNGRGDAWRVATRMAKSAPVEGHGQGTFPLFWTRDRRLEQLYLLQPHNIFLELLAELGAIGVVLFAAALVCIVVGIPRAANTSAAAAGALVALVGQAALDWTWSFPVLVAATLAVAGAASAGRRSRPATGFALVGAVPLLAVVLVLFVPPWRSDRLVAQARGAMAAQPARAADLLGAALAWNRWNAGAYELHGLIEERGGHPSVAADDYVGAAGRSQSPWLDRFLEARAAKESGDAARRRAACAAAHAANPGEHRLYDALC